MCSVASQYHASLAGEMMHILVCAVMGALAAVVSASEQVCNEGAFLLENERRS